MQVVVRVVRKVGLITIHKLNSYCKNDNEHFGDSELALTV